MPIEPQKRENPWVWPTCLILASTVHWSVALGGQQREDFSPTQAQRKTSEIELVAPPEPPPSEPPAPEPPAGATEVRPAAAPAAARAGRILAADPAPNADAKEELADFVTDPNGDTYGSGVVARGGTADYGVAGAVTNGRGSTPGGAAGLGRGSGGDGITAAENLSRMPRLDEADACAGYYPEQATVDAGLVTASLVIKATGKVGTVSVVDESPSQQGFGQAARRCLLAKAFVPALDKQGKAVSAATTLRVRFTR